MAESTGVTESNRTEGGNHERNRGGGGSFFKRNKKVILIGGGAGVFLLMSHKGSTSSSGSSTAAADAAQQQADALAAQQAALESGNVYPPAGYSSDTSGGGGGSTGSTDTTGTTDTGSNSQPASVPTTQNGPINIVVPPNEPPTVGTNPPDHKGKTKHKNHGTKVQGHTGTTVHGRHFPGAKGHTMHPPKRQPNGDIHQRVTIHHGGHTTHHTSVNRGQTWIDHPKGSSPPKRSTPVTHGSTARPAPRQYEGAPGSRPGAVRVHPRPVHHAPPHPARRGR